MTEDERWQRTREVLAGFATAQALLVCMLEADGRIPSCEYIDRLRAAVRTGSVSAGTEIAFEAIIGEIDRLQDRSDEQPAAALIESRH